MFVYYNKVSSIVFKLMISLYAITNHKRIWLSQTLELFQGNIIIIAIIVNIIIIIAIIIIIITTKCLFVYGILNSTGI